MRHRLRSHLSILFAIVVLGAPSLASALQRQADPNSPRFQGVVAMREMLGSEGDEPLRLFIKERMAASVTAEYDEADLLEMLRTTRSAFTGSEYQGAMPEGPYTVVMMFEPKDGDSPSRLTFEIEAAAPHRFVYLDY